MVQIHQNDGFGWFSYLTRLIISFRGPREAIINLHIIRFWRMGIHGFRGISSSRHHLEAEPPCLEMPSGGRSSLPGDGDRMIISRLRPNRSNRWIFTKMMILILLQTNSGTDCTVWARIGLPKVSFWGCGDFGISSYFDKFKKIWRNPKVTKEAQPGGSFPDLGQFDVMPMWRYTILSHLQKTLSRGSTPDKK